MSQSNTHSAADSDDVSVSASVAVAAIAASDAASDEETPTDARECLTRLHDA